MPTTCYRVAGGVTFGVRATDPTPKLLSRAFGPEVAEGVQPQLELRLDGAPGADTDTVVKGVYKGLPWSCGVAFRDDRLVLGFRSPVMREYLAMHIALLPALRHLLARQGVALILGAAFARDGAATVLTAPTGTGKTSLLLGALQRGATFVGDEYVGVSSDGAVGSIVRSLALRRSSLALVSDADARLGRSRSLALRAAEVATRLTGGKLEPLNHVRPEEVGMSVSEGPAQIEGIIWLSAGDETVTPALTDIPREEVVQQLALRQAEHQVAYGDITPYLAAATGCTNIEELWRAALSGGLSGVACRRLAFSHARAAEAVELLLSEAAG